MDFFLLRKIKGCVLFRKSGQHQVSLVQAGGAHGELLGFVLHLTFVPASAAYGISTSHIVLLEEKEVGQAIGRYFSIKGGVGRDFPGVQNVQWKTSESWFDRAVHNCEQGDIWIKVQQPFPFEVVAD